MVDSPTNLSLGRRRFLRTGATGSMLLVAGCSGGGTNNSTNSSGGGGSGTTITYSSRASQIRPAAKEQMNKWLSEFEQKTGHTVNLRPSQGVSAQQQKYRQMFEQGNLPVLFDSGPHDVGPFGTTKYFRPLGEYIDRIRDNNARQIKNWIPEFEATFGPVDIGTPNSLCYPAWFSPFSAMVGRRSHYRKAGLDPDKKFPPKSYGQFRTQAKALANGAPSEYVVGLTGNSVLAIDNGYLLWTLGADADRGRVFNTDWNTPYMGNDVWLEQTKRFANTFEQDWTSPQSLTLGDQQVTRLIAQDFLSLGWASIQVVPSAEANAPDAFDNNDMMFGLPWSTKDGEPGHIAPYGFWLARKPRGVSNAVWEEKTDAAIELMNFLLTREKQMQAINQFGQYPVRKDVMNAIKKRYDEYHHHNVAIRLGEQSHYLWPAQNATTLLFGEGPVIGGNAMRGTTTPRNACNRWMNNAKEALAQ